MPDPLVSVIIPCHNCADHLTRAIDSVATQSYANIEIIVVNDGSTDTSSEIISEHSARITSLSQRNMGVSSARNFGIRHSSGKYIAFLDADDTWEKTFIEKMLHALQGDPEAVIAYCGWQNLGLSGGRGDPYIPPDYETVGKVERLLAACPWPIHAALTQSEAIRIAGAFDTRYANSEDYALWLGIASFRRIIRIPEVLAYYHHHSDEQASRNLVRAAKDTWLVQQRFLASYPRVYEQIEKGVAKGVTCRSLLKRGYDCYWKRDLDSARDIFRFAMRCGCGALKDWKYMLPSLLPRSWHKALLNTFESKR